MEQSKPVYGAEQSTLAKQLSYSILILISGYALVTMAMSVLMNHVIDEFGLVGAQEGSMSSMISFGGMLALLSTPLLQGHIKKTTMLIVSGVLQVAMMAVTGFAPTYGVLLAVCILLGISGGWTDSYCNSSIVDINRENSSKYLGALHGWYGVGGLAAPLLIQALLRSMDWRGVYFALSVVVGLTLLQFLLAARRIKGRFDVSGMEEPRLKRHEMADFLKDKRNLLLLCAGVFYAFTQTGLLVWVVRYMTVRFDAELLGASALSAFWVFGTLSRFLAPRIKMRPLKLFIIGAGAAGVLQAAGVLSASPVVMVIATGMIGLFSGQCMPMILDEAAQRYPGRTSLPTSLMLFVTCVARVLMPLIMGGLSAAISVAASMLIPVGTGILAGLLGVVALRADTADVGVAQ